MFSLLLKRSAQALLMMWGVGTLTFLLMRSLPGDMAYRIAAGRYGMDAVDADAAASVRAELGLDQGPLQAYLQWLWELASGNLGQSLVSGRPVAEELWHMLSHSALLALAATVLAVLVALPLGVATAWFGGWLDRIALMLASAVKALPVFVIGVVLIIAFALELSWFPVAGFGSIEHLILPASALALGLAAVLSRVVHTQTQRVLNAPFFEFAQTKGLSKWQAFRRHGMRNIAVPVVAFLGIQMAMLVEGVVMIESLFSWPGVGHGLAHAIFSRDIPVIQGTALAMAGLFLLLNTLVDMACYVIDPRGGRDASN